MSASQGPAAGATTVLGAGSWGTALAILLARNGRPTTLWSHDPAQVETMRADGRNRRYLPDDAFPEDLCVEADIERAVAACRNVLIVVPSGAFRQVLDEIAPLLQPYHRVLWGTKGLEPDSRKLLHQVAAEVIDFGWPMAVLSGPTFAREVARGLPTAITVASRDEAFARDVAGLVHGERFRAYTSTDVVGVEIAGALKNVIALASGMCDGLGLGDNSKAAIITRGLAEIVRLGMHLGGDPRTFYGLAGLGDLVATCASAQSRNHLAGVRFAHGATLAQIEASHLTAEGIPTALAVHRKMLEMGLEMPISSEVYRVVYEGKAVEDALRALMEREAKAE